MISVGRRLGVRLHFRGVGTDAGFRQRKRRDLSLGYPRQKFSFLVLRPKQDQRLRHTD
jgi:hypothetical protein